MGLWGLPYLGGKSSYGMVGNWIRELIPWDKDSLYCEPFCGMLGVLLARPPVRTEIANDADRRIVDWWRVVRDHTDELQRRLLLTPAAREELSRAISVVSGDTEAKDEIEMARCVSVVLIEKFDHSLSPRIKTWGVNYNADPSRTDRNGMVAAAEKLPALAARMSNVRLECKPAEDLLERLTKVEEAVIYCDPPYIDAVLKYAHDVDRDVLTERFLQQRGKVAVSGWGTEWDHLGWQRHQRSVLNMGRGVSMEASRQEIMEVLWTNYDPELQQLLLF